MRVGRGVVRIGRAWVLPALIGAVVVLVVSAGAMLAIEADTVSSFWAGLWWSISLMTTVGFIGAPPSTAGGALLSVALMVGGFLLLALVSAALASLFVHEDERPRELRQESAEDEILAGLRQLSARLSAIESRLAEIPRGTAESPVAPGAPIG